jgi:L-threonylcarbamoyladenylate synthase
MPTTILPFAVEELCQEVLDLLRGQGVIVAPTDTVYGIMCRFDSAEAVERLYRIKQRPKDKAIPILIGDRAQLPLIARMPIPASANALAARFWPGPLTLVLPARDHLPPALTAGGSTVGVRMPNHPALCDLMRRSGPLAATSANLSGGAETHTAQQALEQLDGLVPLILSDDDTATRSHRPVASTIVDLSGPEPVIIRPGPIADDVLSVLSGLDAPPC